MTTLLRPSNQFPNRPKVERFPKLSLNKKAKTWSHQDDLMALRGKPIDIYVLHSQDWRTGILVEADAFTLKISNIGDSKSVLTYYKHAIAAFRAA